MRKLELYLLLTLMLLAPPLSIAGSSRDNKDELTAVREEIESTKKLLETEREDHQRENEEESLVRERLGQEIIEMKDRLKELKQLKNDLEDQIGQLSGECEMLGSKKSSLDEKFLELRKALVDHTRSFRTRIEKGFPYNKEIRSTDLLILEKDLEAERLECIEGVNRLWDLIEQELSLGSESEVYPGDLPHEEGGVRGARYLRLGMVALAYVSEDGRDVGLLRKKDGDYTWTKDFDQDLKDSIREMQQILEGRSAFRLVNFPIDLGLLKIPGTSSSGD